MQNKSFYFAVGALMIVAILALIFLALKVSGLSMSGGFFGSNTYQVTATFDNIGSLKVRSPVRVAGVQIGTIQAINLNPKTYQAKVTIAIQNRINTLPSDSSASIVAAGLLGDNYMSLSPGYAQTSLHNGSRIQTTYSATNIESLISTFLSGSKK